MRALLLCAAVCVAGYATAEAGHPVEGIWGFPPVSDMTCGVNPVQITLSEDGQQLVMSWPKAVRYDDGSESDGVTFSIVERAGQRLALRRDRDGVAAAITVTSGGNAFDYLQEGPDAGSRFERCATASG